jgi:para-nitrobenzyl esterase
MKCDRRSLLWGGAALAATACAPRVGPIKDASIVETLQGKVRGASQPNGVLAFKGMRYGASTAGSGRFQPPKAPPSWVGVQDALAYGDQCPQAATRLADPNVAMTDDCLRINVWTPGADDASRPVLLWFHGGGFEAGAGSMPLYDGARLARRGDVVVVTINHRLNVFGHCFLGDILGEEFIQSGNVGYLDLIAAMKWVRDNIRGFGGNPNNVMIYGQSGGGRKVSLCYAGKDAAGLFHKGVIESGSHLRVQARERANAQTEALLSQLGIAKADARKLQEVDVKTLEDAQRKAIGGGRFSPMLDGVTFTADPFLPEAPSISSHLPLIVGSNRTELTNQLGNVPGIFDMDEAQAKERLKGYIDKADIDTAWKIFHASRPEATPSEVFFTIASARGYGRDSTILAEQRVKAGGAGKTYFYKLMWRQPVEGGRRVSQHSLDLPFVFDNVAAGAYMTGPQTASTDAMVDNMANTWIAFARSGVPNNPAIPEWRPYDLATRPTMMFDTPSTLAEDPFKAEREFMDRYPSQQDSGRGALHRQASQE